MNSERQTDGPLEADRGAARDPNAPAPLTADRREVRGVELLTALGSAAALAAVAGFVTACTLPHIAPTWSSADRLAALIVAEVYAAIIVGHLIAFHGWSGVQEHLRLRPVTAGQIAAACGVWIAGWTLAGIVYIVVSRWLWPLSYVRDAYVWIGADGRRLATREPLLIWLGSGRAAFVTPVAEEILFRGSLFGWIRRRVTADRAITGLTLAFQPRRLMIALPPAAAKRVLGYIANFTYAAATSSNGMRLK